MIRSAKRQTPRQMRSDTQTDNSPVMHRATDPQQRYTGTAVQWRRQGVRQSVAVPPKFLAIPAELPYQVGPTIKLAALSQRDRAAGWVSFGQK